MRYGLGADDTVLFEATREKTAQPLGSETFNASNANASAYAPVEALGNLWKRYCDAHEGVYSTETTFDDAMHLLEAQGGVFLDAGLAFLHPPFVTDLMARLIDHTLTKEKLKERSFKKEMTAFLKRNKMKIRPKRLSMGLEALVEKGILAGKVLPFLWRDIGLEKAHYDAVLRMLADAGVVFMSSRGSNLGDCQAIVLFRLPEDANPDEDIENRWTGKLSEDESQLELKVDLPFGCPASLGPRFAADAHKLGECVHAWLTGVFVLDKENRRIRVELVHDRGMDESSLVLSIRGRSGDDLSSFGSTILHEAVSWLKREKRDRLPGLEFDPYLSCPVCIRECDGSSAAC